jgi:hypothetical protein
MNENHRARFEVDCQILKGFGVYSIMLFLISIISNGILIFVILKHKSLLMTNTNVLILTVSIINLLATILYSPFTTIATFNCDFIFGRIGCNFEGFVKTFTEITSIYLLICVSYIR